MQGTKMASQALSVDPIDRAWSIFRRGLALIVPLAITILIASWLAALLERWIPALSWSPVGRLAAGLGSALALVLAAGCIRARSASRGLRRPEPTVPRAPVSGAPPKSLPFPTGLAGSLSEIPLDQVCQLLAGSAKTGILTLDLEEGSFAKVYFENGLFVTAQYLDWSGQQAFNAFHQCAVGRFIFQPGGVFPEHPTRLSVTQLLLEAARVSDETSRWEALLTEASNSAEGRSPAT
jgi:hypothetical protein